MSAIAFVNFSVVRLLFSNGFIRMGRVSVSRYARLFCAAICLAGGLAHACDVDVRLRPPDMTLPEPMYSDGELPDGTHSATQTRFALTHSLNVSPAGPLCADVTCRNQAFAVFGEVGFKPVAVVFSSVVRKVPCAQKFLLAHERRHAQAWLDEYPGTARAATAAVCRVARSAPRNASSWPEFKERVKMSILKAWSRRVCRITTYGTELRRPFAGFAASQDAPSG